MEAALRNSYMISTLTMRISQPGKPAEEAMIGKCKHDRVTASPTQRTNWSSMTTSVHDFECICHWLVRHNLITMGSITCRSGEGDVRPCVQCDNLGRPRRP